MPHGTLLQPLLALFIQQLRHSRVRYVRDFHQAPIVVGALPLAGLGAVELVGVVMAELKIGFFLC